jgi:hypothetical protein
MREYPLVDEVGLELAAPFINDYCKRWQLPVHADGIEEVTWLGAWYRAGLRAVAGYRTINDEFPDDLYVYGFYGDGSKWQNSALYAVGRALCRLPYGLIGAVHLPNTRMIKMALRCGFEIKKIDPGADRIAIMWSPKGASRMTWDIATHGMVSA